MDESVLALKKFIRIVSYWSCRNHGNYSYFSLKLYTRLAYKFPTLSHQHVSVIFVGAMLAWFNYRAMALIEGFMSCTFCFIPISKKYADLQQHLHGTSQYKFQDKHLNLEVFPILNSYHVNSLPCIPYVGILNLVNSENLLKYVDCTLLNQVGISVSVQLSRVCVCELSRVLL